MSNIESLAQPFTITIDMHIAHNAYVENMTGVLLAGGESRRMGRDKARIEVAGQPLYKRSLNLLRRYCASVLIAGDRSDLSCDEIPAIPDLYPGSALGGLYTGLSAAETDWIFVAPCDMPTPDARILELMVKQRNGFDAVVPRTPEGYEPVFALYHKRCLPHMEDMLNQGEYRIHDFYRRIHIRFLDCHMLPSGWENTLMNINTPEQLARFKEKMATPVVSIVAKSGTGKTTLLEKLIAEMKRRGYRVGAIKHDAHRFDIDREGKDSWRMTQAGADTMLISSPEKIAMVKQYTPDQEPSLAESVAKYFQDVDIVLTEGFKRSEMPKIEVHRREHSDRLLCREEEHDPTLIAVASDCPLDVDVPVFNINDAKGLCDLITEHYLT